ncbi:lytic transglycosylase domain-containing protein [Pseudoxanthomonas sacheonensis]|uniref:Soluble lytic murein transglycosylase-like protein n=1 Tax=Pseudoxanthomonas sacheonensis TaxID=443615 RepID=A0ABU1RMP5_9GAMM|nr:lytic transglycosylase domain-containing protein [Pseudoxanthomonas sacheonensis]MDR6840053.1 soluble lytic murein transglycosylase-like protein [Pseudoxanthomonas sacheonensis]
MKGASQRYVLPLLVALLALTALPASAGTLYKCTGADGVPNYVSKRVGGASCEVISRYTPDSRSASVSRPVSSVSVPATPTTALGAASSGAMITRPESTVAGAIVPAALPAASKPAPAYGNTRRVVSGQVYSYIKDGVRHYTSARPKGAGVVASVRTIKYSFIETCFACAANPGVNFGTLRLNTAAYQAEISAAARDYGVDEAIVRAIIHAESSFNPMALSHAGAQGLMQLMPATARRFGVTDSYDASQNIRGGVQYLAWLLKRFNGNLTLAAAGYNAGEGAVDRHGGVPPYQETQRYVARVGVLADRYRGSIGAR